MSQELKSEFSISQKARRACWNLTWTLLFRPSPRIAFRYRNWLLRLFGADIGDKVRIYNSVEFFDPANAVLGPRCVIGPKVQFYNVSLIHIGESTIISQGAHLCSATHDFRQDLFPLIKRDITIERNCWIAADAFIGPGVEIASDAVVGARAVVVKNVDCGAVVAGNPAIVVGVRY